MPRLGRLVPEKHTSYQLHKEMSEPQDMSGRVQKISPLSGLDPQTVQPIASCYTYILP